MSDEKTGSVNRQPFSLEMLLRKVFKGIIDPIAGFFLKIGLKPNHITALGFILAAVSAWLIAIGRIQIAGLVLLVGAPLDVIDGSMARKLGETGRYGALLDSVVDRYSELVVLGGLLLYFMDIGSITGMLLVFVSAAGSVMVSYVKARAEALNFNAKVGILTRVERMIVMVICLLIGMPIIALWIIAILANFTAVQRMIFVHKQGKEARS